MQTFPLAEYAPLLPIVALVVAGLGALIADLFLPRGTKVVLSQIAVGGVVLALVAAFVSWYGPTDRAVLGGSIAVSRLGFMLSLAILIAGGATALSSAHYAEGTTIATGEYYGLILFSLAGMLALVIANDLATLFVALETLSICVYALTGISRRARGAEGAMKYFVLGAFSSGFLLYGIALVYGAAGTLQLSEISRNGFGDASPVAAAGIAMVLVGLLFKVGAVPFHAWIPDAYEGAQASVTGFMSVAVKAAAFGAALRVLVAFGGHPSTGMPLRWILWSVAAFTMILGNAGAFLQRNPRRLLAYSGIAHTGYALCGLVSIAHWVDGGAAASPELRSAAEDAAAGILYYLVGYGVTNLAAFAVLCYLERGGEDVDDIDHLKGLGRTKPAVALAMTIAMISLAGVPLTSGFIGKLWVFRAAIASGDTTLVVLGLLTSALSLGYYLRVVVNMYMRSPGEAVPEEPSALPRTVPLGGDSWRWGPRLAFTLAALATILFGIVPGKLLDYATTGARALFS
ncbi:MAG TPA: NADH-quinone oxidoreductase subunit N [Planctomycetota bacterium]|nr:NADH-quinone oxidoreductase subunit N [Planctomycetota bacterium]